MAGADDRPDDIAIVGMACRLPGASTPAELWRNLRAGVESVSFFASAAPGETNDARTVRAVGAIENIERFDAALFGLSPRQAQIMDPQLRLLLQCAWEALEDAGHDASTMSARTGVFVGASASSYLLHHVLAQRDALDDGDGMSLLMRNDKDFYATSIAYALGLCGPSITVGSACSTSLVAVTLACKSLWEHESDVALAGAASIHFPQARGHLYQPGGIYSHDGHCRAFAEDASGTVGADGVALVVLKRLRDACADGDRVYAVVRGAAINNDGARKVGYTAPSVDAQLEVIREAHALAGVEAADIDYVEGHGTGTKLGDEIELSALRRQFASCAPASCGLGSLKSNLGHTDAAAGVASLIKVALALHHEALPPTLHVSRPHAALASGPFRLIDRLQPWPRSPRTRVAGVSSFGVGGTNVHVVVAEAPATSHAMAPVAGPRIFVVSAQSTAALTRNRERLADDIVQRPAEDRDAVAFTLAVGRRELAHRCAVVADDLREAASRLRSVAADCVAEPVTRRRVAFLFPGQGQPFRGRGGELYRSEALYRQLVDRCAAGFARHDVPDLRRWLRDGEPPSGDTAVNQPLLFTFGYALAHWWMDRGLVPSVLIGHSLGELTAACVAEVLQLEDAFAIVAARGRLMQRIGSGGLIAIGAAHEEIAPLLDSRLSVSAVNGARQCVIGGDDEALAELVERCRQARLPMLRLPVDRAFHTAAMRPAAAALLALLQATTLRPPTIPVISTAHGTWLQATQATDPRHWSEQITSPVQLHASLTTLWCDRDDALLELGDGTLTALAARHELRAGRATLPSFAGATTSQHELRELHKTLAQLWMAGVDVDWRRHHADGARRRIGLPTYSFGSERHWLEAAAAPSAIAPSAAWSALPPRQPQVDSWFYVPSWRRTAPLMASGETRRVLVLADERGLGAAVAAALRRRGCATTIVRDGAHFASDHDESFTINCEERLHYRQLLTELREQSRMPTVIVHTLALGATADEREFTGDPARALRTLLTLAQALGELTPAQPIRLVVVVDRAHDVVGGERVHPDQVLPLAAVKIIPREYEDIDARLVDIAFVATADAASLAEQLADETLAPAPERLIAYRGAHRWSESYAPLRAPRPTEVPRRLRRRGTYLITGGLGGFGSTLAGYLARTTAARLILIGRTALPERSRWDEWLATAAPDDAVGRALTVVRELEAAGAEVHVEAADVGDEAAMQAALTRARARFGTINGVLACAGVIDRGGVIQRRSPAALREVLRAKVAGTYILDRLLADEPLDFFIVCSSIGAILSNLKIGEVGYVAASDFLNAFAHARRERRGQPTLAIDWTDWRERGMSLRAQRNLRPVDRENPPPPDLLGGLSNDEAIDVFARLLDVELPQVVVSTRDLDALMALQDRQHASLAGNSPLALPSDDTTTMAAVGAIWKELLGVVAVANHDDFFSLGGDSLLALRVVTRLRERFAVTPSLAAILAHPTLSALAGYMDTLLHAPSVDEAPTPAVADELGAPLTLAQERLWLSEQLTPASSAYHLGSLLHLQGPLSTSALEQSLRALLDSHVALRAKVVTREGTPWQLPGPLSQSTLPMVDLSALDASTRERTRRALAAAELQRRFRLDAGALLRAQLLCEAPQEQVLLTTRHHLGSDGWSLGIIVRQLQALYRAAVDGVPLPNTRPAASFFALARKQRAMLTEARREAATTFWRTELANVEPLPLGEPRPAGPVTAARHRFTLPASTLSRLRALAQRDGGTLMTTLLAGYAALLAQHTRRDDFLIGVPVADRGPAETEIVGCLSHVLPLRVRLPRSLTFSELVVALRERFVAALPHGETPVQRLLPTAPTAGPRPLVQAVLALQNAPLDALELPGVRAQLTELDPTTPKLELVLTIDERSDGLAASFDYDCGALDETTVAAMARHYATLLAAAAAQPKTRVWELPLTSAETPAPYKAEAPSTLDAAFAARATATPDAVAVSADGEQLTYGELLRRADSFAAALRRAGIGPESAVAVCVERAVDAIVAIVAVVRSGGAYVPCETEWPAERVRQVTRAAGATIALVDATGAARVDLPVLRVDLPSPARVAVAELAEPSKLAYVIFTSGSTGQPKGVMVEQRQLLRLFAVTSTPLALSGEDVWSAAHSFAFDFSVWEMWGALLHGARLALAPWSTVRSPAAMARWLRAEQVTVLSQTPTAFQQLAREEWQQSAVRLVTLGGEAVQRGHVAGWLDGARARVVNLYGITETTVHATQLTLQPQHAHGAGSPIGRALDDLRVQVLGDALQPLPAQVPGELFVGGAGVARGYVGMPGLTAERFLPDPLGDGARIYRSGDLGRRREDGELEFNGRADRQLKIRGFRVEPAEVEAALLSHPGVRAAACVAQTMADGTRQLVAFAEAPNATDPKLLRQWIATRLPAAFVPDHVLLRAKLPMNANGKVDLAALAMTEPERPRHRPPDGDVERLVVDIWQRVLGHAVVGRDDDFFALGGHSLLATRVVAKAAEALGIDVPLATLFAAHTVAEFAAALTELVQLADPALAQLLDEVEGLSGADVAKRLDEES